MSLFDRAVDYSKDIFRNIRGIKVSQNLFDDLSDDPLDWVAANDIDIYTHPILKNSQLTQRAFDYSKNEFIDYPFENITSSRYSDGSIACWYGSETLETSIYVNCHGLAFDLSNKVKEFPWLVDPLNYTRCQETGRRVAKEGHPLLIVPSARKLGGVNVVVFKEKILSNVRDNCNLQYIYDLHDKIMKIDRGGEELMTLTFTD